ncbi:MAG: two-component sensor histidine kinase [Paracoccus denitrificans]|nr:MAG: two-component sensor histidine kinase [Paracoccus denitrificans]PZO84151.1 MAG: two-component sensor histidine kinase [Paracoccus denitrificans]
MPADQLRQFVDAIPIAALIVDRTSRIVAANAAATSLFGEGLSNRPFVTAVRHSSVNRALDWVLAPGSKTSPPPDPSLPPPSDGGQRLKAVLSVHGQDRACVISVAPLDLKGGTGAAVVIEDSAGVDQAEQMRRDFVANVSHELRTPLTALMGFIETLRGPARNDEKARDRFLDIMQAEANRMNRLVADLLSLSRVESDERRRPMENVDLSGLIRSVAQTLAPAATRAGVEIEMEGVNRPVPLPGDGDQIMQVIQNLMENSVKYGASGGRVRVVLSHVAHEPVLRGPGWSVQVEDFGDGIDELHLPRLTERFYRVDKHRSREKGGTGLGLAIVKHIVNRHRGRLKIESTLGQGSRFTVILPERQDRR